MNARSTLALSLAALASLPSSSFAQHDDWDHNNRSEIRHVLLISVDGMHAVDYFNCSRGMATVNNGAPFCPNLAALGTRVVN